MNKLSIVAACAAAGLISACGGADRSAANDDDGAPAAAKAPAPSDPFIAAYVAHANKMADLVEGAATVEQLRAVEPQLQAETEALEALMKAEQAKPGFQQMAIRMVTNEAWLEATARLARATAKAAQLDPATAEAISRASNGV